MTENRGAIIIPWPDGADWVVKCRKKSIERMAAWADDPVIENMLRVLRCIPNILVPGELPEKAGKFYRARSPEGDGVWFCAGELRDLQSLRDHDQMTVGELWTIAADLCQTLSQLYSLGVWGHAGRGSVLLRKSPTPGYCLTGITDCHIYQHAQTFPEIHCKGEDVVTTGLRLLVGSVALCADRRPFPGGEKIGPSCLELQLGTACIGELSSLFRTPSSKPPLLFLEDTQSALRRAAKRVQLESPKKLCLYLTLLGSDCRQKAAPALSSVARSFYHCMQELDQGRNTQIDIVCIYPWDTVHICRFGENCIHGLSALEQAQPGAARRVPLGGLLDCLNRELERDIDQGIASLVYYIALPDFDQSLSCMDHVLIRTLAQKRKADICKAFLCSADLRQKVEYVSLASDDRNKDPIDSIDSIDSIDLRELDSKMYFTIEDLLLNKRYSCKK